MSEKKDDLSIPDFLKVSNRTGKEIDQKSMKVRDLDEEEKEVLLSKLTPASRERVERLLKSGKFRIHWLKEKDGVEYTEQRTREINDKAQKAKEANLERLRALPPKEKSVRPKFGTNVSIRVLKEDSGRKPGSKAAAVYAEMVKWVKENPKGDVSRLLEETSYHRGYLKADMASGCVKTDVR